MMLMARSGDLSAKYLENNISSELRNVLTKFIDAQIAKNNFKRSIPYTPPPSIVLWSNDPLVRSFEDGTLDLNDFNHRKHLYVAWCYLKDFTFEAALDIYSNCLFNLLDAANCTNRFNLELTEKYFKLLDKAMEEYPTNNFDELLDKSSILKVKINK